MQQIKLKNEITELRKSKQGQHRQPKKKNNRDRLREKNALKYTGLLFDL